MKYYGPELHIAASTDIGLGSNNNEDAYLIGVDFTINDCTTIPFHSPAGVVLAVADRKSGENVCEITSSLAMSAVREFFLNHLPPVLPLNPLSLRKISSIVKDSILFADSRIKEHAQINRETRSMCTSVVLAWILGNNTYVSWCGDSRAYHFRKGKDLIRLTYDHNRLREILAEDSVLTAESFERPVKNIITEYVGDTNTVPRPYFNGIPLMKGDVLLLCSVGINDLLPDSEIKAILENYPDIDVCKDELIKAANRAGGFDNCTVVLAQRIG